MCVFMHVYKWSQRKSDMIVTGMVGKKLYSYILKLNWQNIAWLKSQNGNAAGGKKGFH